MNPEAIPMVRCATNVILTKAILQPNHTHTHEPALVVTFMTGHRSDGRRAISPGFKNEKAPLCLC